MTAAVGTNAATVSAFRIERDGDLAIIWFDLPGEKVNKFSSAAMTEFSSIVDAMEKSPEIKRIIIASGKPSIFIAGADVSEFTKAATPDQARQYTRFGQQVLHRFSKLPQVKVAAINGACVGGGCELAISCDWRVMTDSPKAQIGLPEVKLGIFPAWGGATKLPRLIGLPAALDIILNGKTVDGKRAKRMGLVDEVVPASILLDVARQLSRKPAGGKSQRTKFYLEGNPLARRIIFSKARKAVLTQTHGNYPAPLKALEVMERGMSAGVEEGLKREVDEVVPLIMGDVAQNLVRLFFLMEDAKKDRGTAAPHEVRRAGVLGADHPGQYDIVVANISTEANVGLSRSFGAAVRPGGTLLLSGILGVDAERVSAAMRARGFALRRMSFEGDWAFFAFERR